MNYETDKEEDNISVFAYNIGVGIKKIINNIK
jgi:hypothetical protein